MLLLLLILLFLMCYHGAARDIAPVVFGAVVATLLVMFVPLSLMLSWIHCLCRWSCCLWCLHSYTARDVGPAVFGIVMATVLLMLFLLSWLHCS